MESENIQKAPRKESEDKFSSNFVFLLTLMMSAIGFGNVWRFPYLVFKYGGVIFIITYFIIVVMFTYPLTILEIGLGQVLRGGQINAWTCMGRRSTGAGLGTWVSFTVCCYYSLLIAWSLIFFVNSFYSPFPWVNDAGWMDTCKSFSDETSCLADPVCLWTRSGTCAADALYNSNLFFKNSVHAYNLFVQPDDQTVRGPFIEPAMGLLVTWVCVGASVFVSAKVLGYTSYLSMTLPVICLVTLVSIASSLDGSGSGIRLYLTNFDVEFSKSTFLDAFCQSMFSASLGQGALTSLSSHNDINTNFAVSSMVLLTGDTMFALISGFAVYGMLGFLSKQSGISIQESQYSGISLAFTAFPAALSIIPGVLSNISAIIFFFTLFVLGYSTLVTLVESLVLSIIVSRLGKRFGINRWQATVFFTVLFFLVPGMLLSTNLGMSLLDSIDNYSAIGQGFAAGIQAVAAGWTYLSYYTIQKAGGLANTVHLVSFFLGAILLGIFDTISGIAAIVLGILVPAIGFGAALYLTKQHDEKGNTLTWMDRIYYLTIYNVKPLQKRLTAVIPKRAWITVPRYWPIAIKYFIPYATAYLVSSSVTDPGKITYIPNRETPYPAYIRIIGMLSPGIMVVIMLVSFLLPQLFTPLFPPEADLDNVFGEELIGSCDRYADKLPIVSSHVPDDAKVVS